MGAAKQHFLVCHHDGKHAVCRSWRVDADAMLIVSRPAAEVDFCLLGHKPMYGCLRPASAAKREVA